MSGTVNASPTKTFFVDMLTRDIDLKDAILDLLDNCVDGIQRITKDSEAAETPYQGYWAKITFSDKEFKIEDNCGGIPLKVAEQYAFRMGRPADKVDEDIQLYTIGTYGIGMKRAIFKMGRSSEVISQTIDSSFKVSISDDWLTSDHNWDLPLEEMTPVLKSNGTLITVHNLLPHIQDKFSSSESTLYDDLVGEIQRHYTYIFHKGFRVEVNGNQVTPEPWILKWDGQEFLEQETIAPYLYKAVIDDVEVRLAVGFYTENPDDTELDDIVEGKQRRSDNAGWTIICNDRVVLYCDKSILTGWGEATVPRYHPQFIAISGAVEFRSHDPRKLPITTTKRGIDASSSLYLYVKNFMREGLKHFTAYTNRWKRDSLSEKQRYSRTRSIDPTTLFTTHSKVDIPWKSVKSRSSLGNGNKAVEENKYIPNLPKPKASDDQDNLHTIKFTKPLSEIQSVAEYIFEDANHDPSEVGAECFNMILKKSI
jgi:hypothetical protein